MIEGSNKISIRAFQSEEDLEFAALQTQKEGWHSETLAELRTFFTYDPQGCFLAEKNNEKIGVCFATAYKRAGFIGELIVDQPFRNQGVGKALMESSLRYLKTKIIDTVFLDGVQKAVPLYQSLGFTPQYRSLRFFGQIQAQESTSVRQISKSDLEEIFSLDNLLFGDDRSFFLRKRFENYPELAFINEVDGRIESYIFGRVGRAGWVSVGPWGIRTEEENQLPLLSHFQSKIGNQPFSIGILEPRTSIIKQLILTAGMQPRKDPPIRMKFGLGIDLGDHERCLAIGSPAKG